MDTGIGPKRSTNYETLLVPRDCHVLGKYSTVDSPPPLELSSALLMFLRLGFALQPRLALSFNHPASLFQGLGLSVFTNMPSQNLFCKLRTCFGVLVSQFSVTNSHSSHREPLVSVTRACVRTPTALSASWAAPEMSWDCTVLQLAPFSCTPVCNCVHTLCTANCGSFSHETPNSST